MVRLPITDESLATWLTPREAVELLSPWYSGHRVVEAALLERLMGGLINAHARSSAHGQHGGTPTSPVFVPNTHWGSLSGPTGANRFWETGDARMFFRHNGDIIRYYGIRFDPDGVSALLPKNSDKNHPESAVPKLAEPAALAAADDPKPELEQPGPRVSDPALQAWYSAYQSAYQVAEQTEAHAVRSAKGMFHDKSVARDRIRTLLGSRKRGPKTKTDNG